MTLHNPVGWASPTIPLDELQRWLLTAITNPHGIAPPALEATILPSRQQSAADRLAVYQHAYLARLLEVLREQFPCTRFAIGDELFDQFASAYLAAYPPHSYTLARLADHLVDYLNASRPADWGAFVVELARLEHAIDRVFDAPGPETLPPFALPAQANDDLKLTLVPGFELLAFHYPVSAYYSDWKAGRRPEWPTERSQYLALLRRDYIVRRYELTAAQYRVLLALQRGSNLSEALAFAFDSPAQFPADLAAQLRDWFQFWAAERFFAGGAGLK